MNAAAGKTEAVPAIAVTAGDPGGIGPEIVARLFAVLAPERSRPVVIGTPAAFGPWLEKTGLRYTTIDDPADLASAPPGVVILDTNVHDGFPLGTDSAGGGRHAGRAIEVACALAKNRSVVGIVTAPISKKSLNLAKFQFPGHTEMLARYLNSPDCQMMMVVDNLRVVPLTRHLPLKDVSGYITLDSVKTCVRVTAAALKDDFGVADPRIAVAGLNPHAGDRGVIGNEEQEVIAPAIADLRREGLDVSGPFAGDGLFPSAYKEFHHRDAGGAPARGRFDAYVAMYHDQGLIPYKMLAQRRGVNVTIGLPVVRTSVDHGVAFDLAGSGNADTESLLAAYRLAERLAINRSNRHDEK